jgi:hypothetical protein
VRSISLFVVGIVCLSAVAQSPAPPLSDSRYRIETLIREDIFAGLLDEDLERLARGEKNIEILLEKRPAERPSLLVWKAGAALYRAVRAREANHTQEFEQKYGQATELLAQARKLGPRDLGFVAAMGGLYAVLADRLPEKERAAAWSAAYDSYQALWKAQGGFIDKLPTHLRGELLAGLAQSAQRTGRTKELAGYLDRIVAVMPESPYARVARRWQSDPKAAVNTHITCLSCHAPGRLEGSGPPEQK